MFLEIRDIRKSFGSGDSKVDVLKGLDLDIEKGEFCVLLGPSGSGKSTLLNIIGGIESADAGSISIEGEKLADMKEKKLSQYRRKHLGYIFQMYNLIPNLTVRENIEVGAYLSDRALDVDELLHTLGLYEHQRKLPNQLSGVGISAMPQSFDSSMKSRILEDVIACASLMPVSRSGMTTRSAPTFSSAFLRNSSVALQITCGTPRSLRLSVAMMHVARSEPMATTAQSQLLAPSERSTSSSRTSATTAQVTLDSMR